MWTLIGMIILILLVIALDLYLIFHPNFNSINEDFYAGMAILQGVGGIIGFILGMLENSPILIVGIICILFSVCIYISGEVLYESVGHWVIRKYIKRGEN